MTNNFVCCQAQLHVSFFLSSFTAYQHLALFTIPSLVKHALFFSSEDPIFLLLLWSFLLSCLFWLESDQILNIEVPHSLALSSLYLLFTLHSHSFKNHLYANNSQIYILGSALPSVLLFHLSKLLTWQLHMRVSQMSQT